MSDTDEFVELDWERFDALLRERGLTAYRVSKDTGISQTTFSSWKHRTQATISAKTNRKLSKYFNVPIGYFHGEYKIHDDPLDPLDVRDSAPDKKEIKQIKSTSRGAFQFDLEQFVRGIVQDEMKKIIRDIIRSEIRKCMREAFTEEKQ